MPFALWFCVDDRLCGKEMAFSLPSETNVAVVLCRSFLVDFRHIFVNFFEFIQRS